MRLLIIIWRPAFRPPLVALGQLFHRTGCGETSQPKRAEPGIWVVNGDDIRPSDDLLVSIWRCSTGLVTAVVGAAAPLDASTFPPQARC
ncbi:hypothetical protein B0T16DRAFT_420036 [Cercophora newfieldiana]|uniref:Uncharacterized protein n=1 Tax=Cercophora newfieldiana TaxID=92897 RepID=A0AA39XWH6_9PEZI|nr:hypothetical protein B0T16DRAFT_420036 [Cercophora newfieldiana]